jgi:hypothetical protein
MPTNLDQSNNQVSVTTTIIADHKSVFFERDLRAERSRILVDALGHGFTILRQTLARLLFSYLIRASGAQDSSRAKVSGPSQVEPGS